MKFVYNSYEGRFSDSPWVLYRALLERGGHEHVWLADPEHVDAFPDGVETVAYGSPAAVEALEACDALIANTHTDFDWEKGPDTLYLQTWHGTPLKRIHWDVLWAPPGRLERLSRDVERWDVLLSPNAASTPFLRRAFRYEGEVLECGYPRNDLLLAADREDVRARVRASVGVDEGQTAVLYTPTWRDDMVFAEGGKAFALGLDAARVADALGPRYVVLLRVHYMLTGRLAGVAHERVRDVSRHADVSELYLAADAMVTDYSSTMFDFAVTGKPLLFYTYDLADYERRLRGFYFDLASVAPGPMVETEEELVRALRSLPEVARAHAERYAAFRERFVALEDGRATERVVARVVAGRGAAARERTRVGRAPSD